VPRVRFCKQGQFDEGLIFWYLVNVFSHEHPEHYWRLVLIDDEVWAITPDEQEKLRREYGKRVRDFLTKEPI